ncbi:phosphotransferase enzyme family protein [Ralstonia solanacearum]|uniref:phosphotransferase enzyme family protein n=1 Tax=Ralstonia solanacearum TaxID=305 RepID=UPI0034DD1A55
MTLSLPVDIAQTTPTGRAVANAVAAGYAFGEILDCVLLRRGFNHVYALRFSDGRRAVARLSARRPRGAANIEFEAALLTYLKAAGAAVAASLPTRDGAAAILMTLPEGAHPLMLFEYLDGDPPGEDLADIEATGNGLALLHLAGQDYDGPASRYQLELPLLLDQSLHRLRSAPMMDDVLRSRFTSIAGRVAERIAAIPELTRVNCHGDCHGSNNYMTEGPGGARIASFFDFDDAGPGWLAYELSVYLWSMLQRTASAEPDAATRERWNRYIAGYRSVRAISDADFSAVVPFVIVRHFWLMGEYAGRIDMWGTQAMPKTWLQKQVELLTAWETLQTPD